MNVEQVDLTIREWLVGNAIVFKTGGVQAPLVTIGALGADYASKDLTPCTLFIFMGTRTRASAYDGSSIVRRYHAW